MYEHLKLFLSGIFPLYEIDRKTAEPLLKSKVVKKGELLFREGDICDFVGLTMKGCLRTFFLDDGKELTLFFHTENQVLGDYKSFRLQCPADFSCQAVEDSEILVINHPLFNALESAPDGQKLIKMIVERLGFELRDRLISLYKDSPETRFLHLQQTQTHLLRRIPQHYLASYLGIEPESLSRLKRRIYRRRLS
jgi:CRP-like cAMP-binding protein